MPAVRCRRKTDLPETGEFLLLQDRRIAYRLCAAPKTEEVSGVETYIDEMLPIL